jgi:hypothetical protein
LSANATFDLACSGSGGTVSRSVIVSVSAPPAPPTSPGTTDSSPGGGGAFGVGSLAALFGLALLATRRRAVRAVAVRCG